MRERIRVTNNLTQITDETNNIYIYTDIVYIYIYIYIYIILLVVFWQALCFF